MASPRAYIHLAPPVIQRTLLTTVIVIAALAGGAGPSAAQPVTFDTYLDTNVFFPTALAFAPDGRLFFTELQTGNIKIVENDVLVSPPFAQLDVEQGAETGLIGLTFDNDFEENGFVYCWYQPADSALARVTRFTAVGNTSTDQTHLIELPVSISHNGGNLAVSPDDKLFIGIGDNADNANAPNPDVLPGSILRYNLDGSIPTDNPYGPNNPVWAIGQRNPFDLTFHPTTGGLYAVDVGPECDDELNKIVAQGNYGWRPGEPCGDTDPTYIQPLYEWNPLATPTGLTFYDGTVYPQLTGDLIVSNFNQPPNIWRFRLGGANLDVVEEVEVLIPSPTQTFLLDVTQSPDGYLYFCDLTAIYRIVNTSTAVAGSGAPPRRLELSLSRPNPAVLGSSVTIPFALTEGVAVRLDIHDVTGRHVRALVRRPMAAGRHSVAWDGRNDGGQLLPAGTYFYELTAGNEVDSRRVVLVR